MQSDQRLSSVTFLPARLSQNITRATSAIVVQILPVRCDLDTFSVVCKESRRCSVTRIRKEKSRRRSPPDLLPAIRQRQEIGTIVYAQRISSHVFAAHGSRHGAASLNMQLANLFPTAIFASRVLPIGLKSTHGQVCT